MKVKVVVGTALALGGIALLKSCAYIPKKATPVTNFNVDRYLGTWYEIARFDFRFEKNLNNTTAQYSLKNDKNIKVLNRGYNFKNDKWKSAEGTAKFRKDKNTGALKVSFFGPFYSGYNVIALDENYRYALIAGKNLNYLWILSREKTIPADVREAYLKQAAAIGYDTSKLIWVKHDRNNPFISSSSAK